MGVATMYNAAGPVDDLVSLGRGVAPVDALCERDKVVFHFY
jgi:hypothetical protein